MFPQDPKLKREWLIKMKRECFTPSKHSRVCAEHFIEDSFEQNLTVWSFLGPSFKPRRLVLKKDAVPTIFVTSLWNVASRQLDKNDEQQANNARRIRRMERVASPLSVQLLQSVESWRY